MTVLSSLCWEIFGTILFDEDVAGLVGGVMEKLGKGTLP